MAKKAKKPSKYVRQIRKLSRATRSEYIDRDLGQQAMYNALQGAGSSSIWDVGVLEGETKENDEGTNVLAYAHVLEFGGWAFLRPAWDINQKKYVKQLEAIVERVLMGADDTLEMMEALAEVVAQDQREMIQKRGLVKSGALLGSISKRGVNKPLATRIEAIRLGYGRGPNKADNQKGKGHAAIKRYTTGLMGPKLFERGISKHRAKRSTLGDPMQRHAGGIRKTAVVSPLRKRFRTSL